MAKAIFDLNFLLVNGSIFFVPLLTSFILCALILLTLRWHGHLSLDHCLGVQRMHEAPTPRIGGLAIIIALAVGVMQLEPESNNILRTQFALGFILFSFGFIEDLTKKVSVALRLWAGFIPGVLGYFLAGISLSYVGWAPLDWALSFTPVAVLFGAFAVGGLTHAINIIDGFNGLCAGASLWALSAIIIIALQVGDSALALSNLVVVASIVGFLFFNWPFGKIFLGDGGSYLLGFCVAWSSVLLAMRNPEVSPFALLLICVYPITEVLYSIVRRLKSKRRTGQPDRLHLHQLVASAWVYPNCGSLSGIYKNSLTGLLMSLLMVPPLLAAITFYRQTTVLFWACVLFVLVYHVLYQKALSSAAGREHLHGGGLNQASRHS